MIKKIIIWLLMATILTPFIVDTSALSPYMSGKIIFLRAIAFIAFTLFSYLLIFSKKDGKEKLFTQINISIRDPLFWAVTVNIFFLGISTIFAYDRGVAFFGNLGRGEGFVTFFVLFSIFLLMRFIFDLKEWRIFYMHLASSSIVIFIIEFFQSFSDSRPSALSGNPIFLASYMLFPIFAGLYLVLDGKNTKIFSVKFLGYCAIVVGVFGIFLTRSRGALVALFAGALVTAIFYLLFKKSDQSGTKIKKIIGAILVFFILSGTLVYFTRESVFWKNIPGVDRLVQISNSDATTSSRLFFTKTSISAFVADKNITRKVFGWGWDNYLFFWTKNNDPKVFFYDPGVADRAHNKYVDLLVMTGIIGLISYLTVWFIFAKQVLSHARKNAQKVVPFVFLTTAYLVNVFFSFDTPVVVLFLFSIIAFWEKYKYEQK